MSLLFPIQITAPKGYLWKYDMKGNENYVYVGVDLLEEFVLRATISIRPDTAFWAGNHSSYTGPLSEEISHALPDKYLQAQCQPRDKVFMSDPDPDLIHILLRDQPTITDILTGDVWTRSLLEQKLPRLLSASFGGGLMKCSDGAFKIVLRERGKSVVIETLEGGYNLRQRAENPDGKTITLNCSLSPYTI